ncbi:MAG: cytochrome c [Verrucomicrobiota bacterium]
MRYVLLTLLVATLVVATFAGLRGGFSRKPPLELFPDMVRQPKLRPQFQNGFFPDGRASQPQPEGTIAQGEPFQDLPLHTGRVTGTTNFVTVNPIPVTAAVRERGRERFNIVCANCHGPLGDGNSISRKLGAMPIVANLLEKRLVTMTDGEIFNTITRGKNLMNGYAGEIEPLDRWAIIAYLRTLQAGKY